MAHPVPGEVRDRLWTRLAPYRSAHPGLRWTRPASWHLTLVFLGSVEPARVPELQRLVDRVAAGDPPYRVEIGAGGGRVRGADGVAWLGLSSGAGTLIEIATKLAVGSTPVLTQGRPPKRTPAAHLTLVRKADEAVIRDLREQAHGPLDDDWLADRLQLVRSHLDSSGARYETLHEATL